MKTMAGIVSVSVDVVFSATPFRTATSRWRIRPAFPPAAEIRDVGMAFGQLLGIQAPRNDAAVVKADRAAIQTGRLARLDPTPDVVGHAIDLTRDRDPALGGPVHPRMDVADRMDP